MYDLVIIGAGPAGITASIYAARKGMDFIVASEDVGGQAAWSGDIENYTGYQFITGSELALKFEEHMRKFSIKLRDNEKVISLNNADNIIQVKSNKETYSARTVIIASGKRSRELNVQGEREFKNKGLTYCATCDGPLFAGKDVAVIGAGNSALNAALQLEKIARHIYIININPRLGGDAIMREKVESGNIMSILNNTQVTAVLGDKFVNAIKIKRLQPQIKAANGTDREEVISVQGVFVEIGLIPNSEFAQYIEKNELGEIKVNCRNETNMAGIFAAGDVTDVAEKQIVIAAGEGAKAALSAFRYLIQQK